MQTKDFDFDLPEHLIAQTPMEDRTSSRLMVLDKETGAIEHKIFKDVINYLRPGDCLVLNNTRVIPARLFGIRESGALVEFLLLKRIDHHTWETLVKPGRKARIGDKFSFGEGVLKAEIVDYGDEGARIIRFEFEGIFESHLDQLGTMPLPPYIQTQLEDQERYQTVFSKTPGSAAAPTAGLHFTQELLERIEELGVSVAYITLHVGLGTFRPVKVDNVLDHKMHAEYYEISAETAALINHTKSKSGRIITVGTTSTRTLEGATSELGLVEAGSGWTDIFIYPGYKFKVVDGIITNFHLPESTLIMLVSALAGKENVMNAYAVAVQESYRFFSFGDAMLILK
jgi:S-adenosylmethionine:tRNA ribosyltransferase-isomerase